MELKKIGKVPVMEQKLPLVEGELPVLPTPGETATIRWKGAPMSKKVFRRILAFFKWSYDTHKVESQVRLFYNEDKRRWTVCVLPQWIGSAASSNESESPEHAEERNRVLADMERRGYDFAGTGHHHSSMSAFQSGTDHADEIKQPGLHFTIGKLNGNTAELHTRFTIRETQYDDGGDNEGSTRESGLIFDTSSIYTQDPVTNGWLSLEDLPAFPESWKGRMKQRPKTWGRGTTGFDNYPLPNNSGYRYTEYGYAEYDPDSWRPYSAAMARANKESTSLEELLPQVTEGIADFGYTIASELGIVDQLLASKNSLESFLEVLFDMVAKTAGGLKAAYYASARFATPEIAEGIVDSLRDMSLLGHAIPPELSNDDLAKVFRYGYVTVTMQRNIVKGAAVAFEELNNEAFLFDMADYRSRETVVN